MHARFRLTAFIILALVLIFFVAGCIQLPGQRPELGLSALNPQPDNWGETCFAPADDSAWEVNGEADLGKLAGGTYYYEGRITPTHFPSTYRSKYDHGSFELRRP